VILIGLTGGIGSGKSEVARMLAERGAVVIDADDVARQVVKPGMPALAAIVERFGPGVVTAGGELDRHALAAVVFSDITQLRALEQITHPAIRSLTSAMIVEERMAGTEVLVHEVSILVEMGSSEMYDFIVVVDAPEDVRVSRAMARGMDEADVRRRMAVQTERSDLLEAADVVLDNAGDRASLHEQVDALWDQLSATA
jgi:dephospho-CoA kinase